MTEASNTSEPAVSPAGDPRFVLAVGVMLVLIIGMLAYLWLRERRTRIGLESDLAEVRKRTSEMQVLQALMGQAGATAGGGVEAFSWLKDRDAAPDAKATVDGQPYAAVRITREAGERLGFRPGDLILVSKTPTATAPAVTASAPARASP